MNKLISATLISACVAVITSSVAVAQTAPNADVRSTPAHARRFAERPFSRPTERVEARLAYLKTALKITDAQNPQWNAFADLVRKNAQEREQRFKSTRGGAREHRAEHRASAIERMEKAQSFHAAAVAHLSQLLEVTKPLYAVLSPEQQKVANVLFSRRFGAARGQWMHGRGEFGRG